MEWDRGLLLFDAITETTDLKEIILILNYLE